MSLLPYRNGFDVCRGVRHTRVGDSHSELTVRDQVVDKVVGLNLGADDYMTKPFEPRTHCSCPALLRRRTNPYGQGVSPIRSIRVDVRRAEVTRDGKLFISRLGVPTSLLLMERTGSTVLELNCCGRCGAMRPVRSLVQSMHTWPACAKVGGKSGPARAYSYDPWSRLQVYGIKSELNWPSLDLRSPEPASAKPPLIP